MKHTLYSILAIVGVASLASCSDEKETLLVENGQEVTVSLSAQLPSQMQSRAFSDGTQATKLMYGVYEKGTTTPVITGDATFYALQTTINVQLITGKEYDFVFWAQDPEATQFKVQLDGQTVEIDYSAAKASDESYDAFFANDSFQVTGSMSKTVTLRRPFAQINVGTDDLGVKALEGKTVTAGMTVTKAYNKMNLMNGKVDAKSYDVVTFQADALPTKQTFPVDGYTYLEMGYVLVDEKVTANIDLNFLVDGQSYNDISVTYVPLQRNYRTNIYGSLLTSNTAFNVVIAPGFYAPDFNEEVVVVASNTELVSALTSAAPLTVNVPAKVKLDLTATGIASTIDITDGTSLVIDGTIVTGSNQLRVAENGTLNVSGTGEIHASDRGGFQVLNGSTLIASGITITSNNKIAGACIHTESGAKAVILDGVTMNAAFRGVYADNIGELKVTNCTMNATSTSSYDHTNWTYAFRVMNGTQATFDGLVCNAIQGAVSVEGAGTVATFDNCNITTAPSAAGLNDAFYCIYATDNGQAIINSGNYKVPANRYAVATGDNDIQLPDGNVVLKGGNFSSKAYDFVSKDFIEAATGYKWVEDATNAEYPWSVVVVE